MRAVSLAALNFYQRFVSPYKGFRCAFSIYHNTESCSGQVKNIISSVGLSRGWPLIRSQFQKCREAAVMLTQFDPPEGEHGEKEEQRNEGWCFAAPAACAVPDPSDCGLGSAAGGCADGAGACSCL